MNDDKMRERLANAKSLREIWFAESEKLHSGECQGEGLWEQRDLVEQCRQAFEHEASQVCSFLIGYYWLDEADGR